MTHLEITIQRVRKRIYDMSEAKREYEKTIDSLKKTLPIIENQILEANETLKKLTDEKSV